MFFFLKVLCIDLFLFHEKSFETIHVDAWLLKNVLYGTLMGLEMMLTVDYDLSYSFQPEVLWFFCMWHLRLVWTMIGWHIVSKRKEVEAASLFKAFIQQYQSITFALFYWSKAVKSSQDSREEKLRSICWCEVQQEHRERREIVKISFQSSYLI